MEQLLAALRPNHSRDLRVRVLEDLAQNKDRALLWGEPLEEDQQGDANGLALDRALEQTSPRHIRHIFRLCPAEFCIHDIFSEESRSYPDTSGQSRRLQSTLDELKDRFGENAIQRGRHVRPPKRPNRRD